MFHTEVLTPEERQRKAAEMLHDAATIRTQIKAAKKLEKCLKKEAFRLLGIEIIRLS